MKNLNEILNTETANSRRIYLYRLQSGVWGSYGRSAVLLNKLYPNISYVQKEVSGNGEKFPFMMIDYLTLADLLVHIPPVTQNEESIIVELSKNALCYI